MAYVIPCVRFNRAVSPSLGLQVSFRISVGDAVSSAIFNGLANTTATLGSFYWLGFETSGLSPDKKRLALLGAQRLASAATHRKRHADTVIIPFNPIIPPKPPHRSHKP